MRCSQRFIRTFLRIMLKFHVPTVGYYVTPPCLRDATYQLIGATRPSMEVHVGCRPLATTLDPAPGFNVYIYKLGARNRWQKAVSGHLQNSSPASTRRVDPLRL